MAAKIDVPHTSLNSRSSFFIVVPPDIIIKSCMLCMLTFCLRYTCRVFIFKRWWYADTNECQMDVFVTLDLGCPNFTANCNHEEMLL